MFRVTILIYAVLQHLWEGKCLDVNKLIYFYFLCIVIATGSLQLLDATNAGPESQNVTPPDLIFDNRGSDD